MTHPNHDIQRSLNLHLRDEAATAHLGRRLAATLAPGMRIYLRGDLGAGKTTLVRALLRALGFQGPVKSPSYALVELYTVSSLDLYHFDFFRFRNPNEWSDAGFREYFNNHGVCLVEWPERAGDVLPLPDVEIFLSTAGAGRDASLAAHTEAGEKCLEAASEPKSQDGFS